MRWKGQFQGGQTFKAYSYNLDELILIMLMVLSDLAILCGENLFYYQKFSAQKKSVMSVIGVSQTI